MHNLFDVKGKVVVVTGACGVLGTAIVQYFAEEGSKVVLLAREKSRAQAEAIVASILASGGEALYLPSDVMDPALLTQNCEEILQQHGRIDVLMNAAGGNMAPANVGPEQTLFDLDIEAMRRVCDLNIFGTVIPTKIFARPMVEQGRGSIINFCSMSSFRPLTRVAGYGIAKAGVASWTQWLAGELATKFGEGLRVNAIAPGFILTNQNRSLLTNPDGSLTERSHRILKHTPIGRFLKPEELFGALHYLASDASLAVTGTLTVVDGGFNSVSI